MSNSEPKPGKATKRNVDYPLILLGVLLTVVVVLIYVGYDYLRDDTPKAVAILTDPTSEAAPTDDPTPDAVAPANPPAANGKTPPAPGKAVAANSPKNPPAKLPVAAKVAPPTKTTPPVKPVAPVAKVALPAGQTVTHAVQRGESLATLAKRFNLTKAQLTALNPGVSELKPGVTKLKIRVKAVHTVGAGDILRKVADQYGVSKQALMAANGKTKDLTTRGEKLLIPVGGK